MVSTSVEHGTLITTSPAGPPLQRRPRLRWWWLTAAGLLVLLVGGIMLQRHRSQEAVAATAPAPTVAMVHPHRGEVREMASFSAEFRPYQEIALYAQVAGFVKTIGVDIGDVVHQGQVLATLEIPELDQQLARAQAAVAQAAGEVERARAQDEDAHECLRRLTAVRAQNQDLVAQQDVDDAQARARAAAASVTAALASQAVAQADLDRLRSEGELCTIRAPFDGVVTRRFADTGAIVRGGVSPSSPAMPLIQLSQNDRLRLRFPVPEHQAALVRIGQGVQVQIDCLGRRLEARVDRIARAVTEDTRTMLVEADVANPDLALLPGMFATVSLATHVVPRALLVPVQAISRDQEGASVFVIGADDRLRRQPVTLGDEMPGEVAILDGLSPTDEVVVGGNERLVDGLQVHPVPAAIAVAQE